MTVIKELNPRRINSPEGCTILIINVCSSRGGVTFIGHIWLIGISDALIGRKFCCILYIIMLYFSSVDTDEFRKRIKERLIKQRSKEFDPSLSLLIPQEGEKIWGEKRKANKVEMLGQLIGYRHKMNTGKDDIYMRKYLTKVSKMGLDKPDYRRRNGRRRKWSKAKSKPGKNVRKRIKLAQGSRTEEKGESVARALDAPGENPPILRPAQIRPSTVGLDNEIRDQDGGKEALVDPMSVEVDTGDRRARMNPVRRTQGGARAAISAAVRFKTYDEMIEERDDIAFPDDLEFNFEIPKEVEEIEV